MARGRGGKAKRGGGHSFSRDLVLDEDGVAVSSERRGSQRKRREEDAANDSNDHSEDSVSDSEEEEEGEGEGDPASSSTPTVLSREDRKAQKAQGKAQAKKKASGGASNSISKVAPDENNDQEDSGDDEDLVNPNLNQSTAKTVPNRKDREAKENKDRFLKAHLAGKTDQAKKDLARLAIIRKQREEASKQREAEQTAREAEIKKKAV